MKTICKTIREDAGRAGHVGSHKITFAVRTLMFDPIG